MIEKKCQIEEMVDYVEIEKNGEEKVSVQAASSTSFKLTRYAMKDVVHGRDSSPEPRALFPSQRLRSECTFTR